MSAETAADRARRLLAGTTPGPWRCDQYDVIPARTVSEGWLIADCGTSDSPDAADANVRLIAAAPTLARDLIAESEAHEVTRGERDEACTDARACAALALTAQTERDEACAEVERLRAELLEAKEQVATLREVVRAEDEQQWRDRLATLRGGT